MADPIPSLYNVLNINRKLPNGGGSFNVANSTPSGVTTPAEAPGAGLLATLANMSTPQNTAAPVVQESSTSVDSSNYPSTGGTADESLESIVSKYKKNTGPTQSWGIGGAAPTDGSAPLDFMSLREEQLRDRANGTGLYSLPSNASLTPDQVFGLRSMADKHYEDLMASATDYSKEMKSTTKAPAYGIDSDLAGMSTNSVNLLYKMSDDFNSHPISKNFNVIQRSSAAANNIINDINSRPDKKPTAGDDMSLMYLFAKAQDPESVVRESEYNNVGEYFSTLPQQVQFKLSTLYKAQPDGRLTDVARKNIANGIKTLYETNKQQYDNLRGNTVDRMKRVAGKDVSDSFLNKYEDGYSTQGGSSSSNSSGDSVGWF